MTATFTETRESLAECLGTLGVAAGDTLLVHASMRSIGWVDGGAATVVQALLDVLGRHGTLVVPAQTPSNRDPSRWVDPPPPERWPAIRAQLPPFFPRSTPSEGMGAIAECVRTWPGAVRSEHPQTSFAAVGPGAVPLLRRHPLESQLGPDSPLGELEKADALVLLLGVGYDRCTAFHLGEYRQPSPPVGNHSCAVLTERGRQWVSYQAVALDDADFARLGADFEIHSGLINVGRVGAAYCRLFPVREAVEFATRWFATNR